MRRLRRLRSHRSVEADLSRSLRAATPRTGERRDRVGGRRARAARQEDGLRQRDLRRSHARHAAGHGRHRPHPLLDRRRQQAVERAADPDRLRARPGRHLPQRQHRQRQRSARSAGSRRIDLPDQQRHRGGAAPVCAIAGRIGRRRAGRGDYPADRRVLVCVDHQGQPDRGARSARLPPARARAARRCVGGDVGNLRARPDWLPATCATSSPARC